MIKQKTICHILYCDLVTRLASQSMKFFNHLDLEIINMNSKLKFKFYTIYCVDS